MVYKYFWKGKYSNWYYSPFVENDIQYTCVEQYMMYHKAILFEDYDIAYDILNAKTPKEHKVLGRKVKNFKIDVWDKNKERIVYNGLKLKFNQNKKLKNEFLKEECDFFVEASPYDLIWGIGLDEKTAIKVGPENWKGENLLGKLLTILYFEFKS